MDEAIHVLVEHLLGDFMLLLQFLEAERHEHELFLVRLLNQRLGVGGGLPQIIQTQHLGELE